MTDPIDKVDYYESFEIYKNATLRITEKARKNRSFSFNDTPVDPRRKVIGHNISHEVFKGRFLVYVPICYGGQDQ